MERAAEGFLSRVKAALLAQLRQACAAQQNPQHRVCQCGAVELAKVRIAAVGVTQHRVAKIMKRRTALLRGDGRIGGSPKRRVHQRTALGEGYEETRIARQRRSGVEVRKTLPFRYAAAGNSRVLME